MLLYPGIEKANKQTNKQPTNYDKKQIIKIELKYLQYIWWLWKGRELDSNNNDNNSCLRSIKEQVNW